MKAKLVQLGSIAFGVRHILHNQGIKLIRVNRDVAVRWALVCSTVCLWPKMLLWPLVSPMIYWMKRLRTSIFFMTADLAPSGLWALEIHELFTLSILWCSLCFTLTFTVIDQPRSTSRHISSNAPVWQKMVWGHLYETNHCQEGGSS